MNAAEGGKLAAISEPDPFAGLPEQQPLAEVGSAGYVSVFVYRRPGRPTICNVYGHDTIAGARSEVARVKRRFRAETAGMNEAARPELLAFVRPLLTAAMFDAEPGGPWL